MRNSRFPIRKAGIFSSGKETEDLRGGVQRYAAQENPKIDAARGKSALSGLKLIYIKSQMKVSIKRCR